jgi:hypothetical protein
MGFEANLAIGQAGESAIARWLRSRGFSALPIYEKIIDTGKGPQFFTPSGSLVAPDLLVCRGKSAFWVEAKNKAAFTWHRNTARWTTGIDWRHYMDYLAVADGSPWPVWLMFLQGAGRAKDSPDGCPTGLYGNDLDVLKSSVNHTSENHGRTGMVYWAEKDLRKMADLHALGM